MVGAKSNGDGIGAHVTVTDNSGRRQSFDVSTAGSYLSSNDSRIIAGLGAVAGVRAVEVRWPSGRLQTLANPEVDRYVTINERDAKEGN